MQSSPHPTDPPEGPRRPYGSDPSADALSLAALAAMPTDGSGASGLAEFRRAALNTVDHLEARLERAVEERNAATAKLSYRLDAAGMARGAAVLLAELRRAVGETDEAARRWLASQFAAVLAGAPETSAEVVAGIAERVGRLGSDRPGVRSATVAAGDWAAAATGPAGTVSDPGTHYRAEVV